MTPSIKDPNVNDFVHILFNVEQGSAHKVYSILLKTLCPLLFLPLRFNSDSSLMPTCNLHIKNDILAKIYDQVCRCLDQTPYMSKTITLPKLLGN